MQQYIQMGKTPTSMVTIRQPDRSMGSNFETTYTEDSGRTIDGVGHFTELFTVEQFSYNATAVTVAEMSQILKFVARGRPFHLHYFSPYYGEWRTDLFYVGKGNLSIGFLNEDSEIYDTLSFNMQGVNPLD